MGIIGLELLFIFLWNSGFIGAEYGLPYAGPWTLLFWRYLILSALLGLWLIFTGRMSWPGTKGVIYSSLVGILAHGVWLTCVLLSINKGVPAGIVALVTALQPMTVGAFTGIVTGEPTKPSQWVGLIIGFFGVVVAVMARLEGSGSAPFWAYLAPFGSVVGITVATLLKRRWAVLGKRSVWPMDLTLFYQGSATALVLFMPAWVFESFKVEWTEPFIGTMLWLVIAVSLGAYWAMWQLVWHLDATKVASLFYFSPPVTMLMAWAVFGDTLILTDILGLIIASVGVVIVYLGKRPKKTSG